MHKISTKVWLKNEVLKPYHALLNLSSPLSKNAAHKQIKVSLEFTLEFSPVWAKYL